MKIYKLIALELYNSLRERGLIEGEFEEPNPVSHNTLSPKPAESETLNLADSEKIDWESFESHFQWKEKIKKK